MDTNFYGLQSREDAKPKSRKPVTEKPEPKQGARRATQQTAEYQSPVKQRSEPRQLGRPVSSADFAIDYSGFGGHGRIGGVRRKNEEPSWCGLRRNGPPGWA